MAIPEGKAGIVVPVERVATMAGPLALYTRQDDT